MTHVENMWKIWCKKIIEAAETEGDEVVLYSAFDRSPVKFKQQKSHMIFSGFLKRSFAALFWTSEGVDAVQMLNLPRRPKMRDETSWYEMIITATFSCRSNRKTIWERAQWFRRYSTQSLDDNNHGLAYQKWPNDPTERKQRHHFVTFRQIVCEKAKQFQLIEYFYAVW